MTSNFLSIGMFEDVPSFRHLFIPMIAIILFKELLK